MLLEGAKFHRSKSWLSHRQAESLLRADIQEYKGYVVAVGSQIGELSPMSGETTRQIRGMLRLAARAMGVSARTWVDGGKVYFFVLPDRIGIL